MLLSSDCYPRLSSVQRSWIETKYAWLDGKLYYGEGGWNITPLPSAETWDGLKGWLVRNECKGDQIIEEAQCTPSPQQQNGTIGTQRNVVVTVTIQGRIHTMTLPVECSSQETPSISVAFAISGKEGTRE